jgi:hypothetical protein
VPEGSCEAERPPWGSDELGTSFAGLNWAVAAFTIISDGPRPMSMPYGYHTIGTRHLASRFEATGDGKRLGEHKDPTSKQEWEGKQAKRKRSLERPKNQGHGKILPF